ncbi:MAG: phage holin family protein [Capsulimonadaceae bacterium]|nr:phage holin family protein [Capsulimonadaceae bacterium]
MKHLLLRWVASAAALIITVYLGHALNLGLEFRATSGGAIVVTAFEAALAFGLVNAVIRPIVELVALPITCLTLGLFSLFVNALMFWLTSAIVPGFRVEGFVAALFGSIAMSLVSGPLNWLLCAALERESE